MKAKRLFYLFLCFCQLQTACLMAQTPSAYKLPDNFQFDYTVTQTLRHARKLPDNSVMHFYYTKSGDYAAAECSRNADSTGNLFIVLTREGIAVVFDQHSKYITVISIRKLVSDLAGLTKWIKMDSLIANMRRKTDGREFKSVKTGNHKQLGKYTTEEYTVSDRRGSRGSVWCAKVDFKTQGDYIMEAVGGNMIKMMGSNMTNHPLLQTLTQPKTLITEIEMNDSAGSRKIEMQTQGIDPVSKIVSTAGYTLNDYSNMTLPEIFQAEMKKRNQRSDDGHR